MSNHPPPPGIDTSVASAARVYDYLLGGTNNYPIDREVAEASGVAIGGMGRARAAVRANRVFLGEAVRRLVAADVRQFLDIGSGLPTEGNVHEVAQREAPDCRIVYVDHDPIVRMHADTLLQSTAEGATSYITGDLVEPETILLRSEATLDFDEPIAVMLVALLHFFHDDQDPVELVARLRSALAPGSYLVVSHLTADFEPSMRAVAASPGDKAQYDFILRSRDELAPFFEGLELVEPGLVAMDEWLPPGTPRGLLTWARTLYGAIGRKQA